MLSSLYNGFALFAQALIDNNIRGMTKSFFKEDTKSFTIVSVPNYGVKCGYDMVHQLSSDVFLQQVIWNNVYFTTKGRPLMYRNWLNSNVHYVKDLYDDDGNFRDIEHFSNIIRNKSNWLCEYRVLKHIFSSFSKRFDCTEVKYINIVNKKCFLFSHKYQNIHEQKANFSTMLCWKRNFKNRAIKISSQGSLILPISTAGIRYMRIKWKTCKIEI